MKRVRVLDKEFELMLPEAELLSRVDAVAERLNNDLNGRTPLFLAVLNGVFMFASDLMKRITIPCEISFVKLSSYSGTESTGKVKQLVGINEDISGRTVVILEDIVETGTTMRMMLDTLAKQGVEDVRICSMFVKPDLLKGAVKVDYPVMEIGNDFILGYGLDYNQQGRNLRDLYVLAPEK